MEKLDVKSKTPEELKIIVAGLGFPSFHAKQLFKWLQTGTEDFNSMSDLPKALREKLEENAYIANVEIEQKYVSKIDGTVKYLYKLPDGSYIESVLMKYDGWYSVCVSSQVGCRMGCKFCASGIYGLSRSLTPSEILAQVTAAERDNSVRVSHIVMMGMGEPLDNFQNTVRFLQLVSHPDGLNLSLRNISVSTSGLANKITELAKYKMPVTLSVSLHNPINSERSKIMPVNRSYNIETLLSACREYIKITGRRISFEYALIEGVNDSDEHACLLAKRLRGMICHVNLIPANPVVENNFKRSNGKRVRAFRKKLESLGINATVRRTLGADINASCGQLRRRQINQQDKSIPNGGAENENSK